MHILYDIDQSVLTPELASICIEYATGHGFVTVDDGNKSLADVIYECYNGPVTSSRNLKAKAPKRLYEMLENEDTRFVDQLCDILYECKFHNNDNSDEMRLKLSKLWIKNKLAALYDTSLIYEFILCLTTKSWNLTDVKSFVFRKSEGANFLAQ